MTHEDDLFENLSKKKADDGDDGGGDGDGGAGRIVPEHPNRSLQTPRNNMSRKGNSHTLT